MMLPNSQTSDIKSELAFGNFQSYVIKKHMERQSQEISSTPLQARC